MRAFNSQKARNQFWNRLHKELSATAVKKAVAGLPEPNRTVIRRHYLEGTPLEQIARDMHRAVSTVRIYHHRGMVLIVQALYPEVESPFDIINRDV